MNKLNQDILNQGILNQEKLNQIKLNQIQLNQAKFWDGVVVCLLLAIGIWGFALNQGTSPTLAAAAIPDNFIAGPVRLHVIANSNSSADQALKLLVRDAVVEYLTPKLSQVTDSKLAEKIVRASLGDLNRIAEGISSSAGYGVNSQLGIFPFPPKKYGQVEMAAGNYKALKINLGEAKGDNWWCVLFPPLCFVDEAGKLIPKAAVLGITENQQNQQNLEYSEDLGIAGLAAKPSILKEQTKVVVKLKINEIFYLKK